MGDLRDNACGEVLIEEVAIAGKQHFLSVFRQKCEVQLGVGVGHHGERLVLDIIHIIIGQR